MSGRKEPPLKLVHASGSTIRVDEGSAALQVPAAEPEMPDAVRGDEELSALWNAVVPDLGRAGIIAAGDALTLEMALRHFRAARRASDDVRANGTTIQDEGGETRKNPADVVFRQQSALFLEYAKQLGMTFVARARTPSAPGGEEGSGGNPFAPGASAR